MIGWMDGWMVGWIERLVGISIENERKKTETYILLARVSFKALPSCFSLVLVDLPCLVPLP